MQLLDCKDAFPKSLSLGMSRRVALARAFAVEPDLLLMDEPFVSLDESTAEDLRNSLVQTWRGKRTTVLFVTHDSRGGYSARPKDDRAVRLAYNHRC